MRLLGPPQAAELERLYHELSLLGGSAAGRPARWRYGKASAEEVVALAAQASRYDPRLLWILVELLARHYDRLNPLLLRRAMQDARWPAALGVAFEFARAARPSRELSDVAAFVLRPFPPASGERFFLLGRALGGKEMQRDADESLAEYRRFGFFSREEPLAKELGGATHGTLGPDERLRLLRRLVERTGTVTLRDYVAALRGRSSYRQARKDLARAPFLTRTGTTRGARYQLREAAAAEQPRRERAAPRREPEPGAPPIEPRRERAAPREPGAPPREPRPGSGRRRRRKPGERSGHKVGATGGRSV